MCRTGSDTWRVSSNLLLKDKSKRSYPALHRQWEKFSPLKARWGAFGPKMAKLITLEASIGPLLQVM
ncbi:hypothetical protein N7451_007258 [Penicillium sp. IBT 35674x]|nr:hypothetical protein N7451_007258 [Penicillium sp. IBT 35674x]